MAGHMNWGDSHTVVVVPVPELEPFVLARTRHYDAAWVSADPTFTHAHVTLFAPWIAEPSEAEMAVLAAIAEQAPRFDVEFAQVEEFPDGTIHLPAEPGEPLSALMRLVSAAFPDLLPYDGLFGPVDELTPHVTLDRTSAAVDVGSTRDLLGDLLPVTCTVDRFELHRYAAGDCRVLASFPLGQSERDRQQHDADQGRHQLLQRR